MKKWEITYEGCLLPYDFTSETYGETEEEALDYAVRTYQIDRKRIKTIKQKTL